MAANPDFKKIVLKDVELLWPRLDTTYRYNSADKRSEACDASVQGASWSVSFKLPMAEAKALKADLKAHYDECRERNRKLPEFSKVFGSKVLEDEDGAKTDDVKFSAEKKAVSNAGKHNAAPRVVGLDLQEIADKAIWSGTRANLRMLACPVTDPQGNGGVKLLLDAVQVIEPVYGGDNLEDDFGPAQEVRTDFSDGFDDEQEAKPEVADAEF